MLMMMGRYCFLTMVCALGAVVALAGESGVDMNAFPNVAQTFCASLHDYLVVGASADGSQPPQRSDFYYSMCMDRTNMAYAKVSPSAEYPGSNVTYIHKNGTLWTIAPSGKDENGGVSMKCTYQSDPSTNLSIPFDFLAVDSDPVRGTATKVNETLIDGMKVETWKHDRGGVHGSMYWFLSVAESPGGMQDMVRTTLLNHMGDGAHMRNSSGNRDMSEHHTRSIPLGTFDVPKGLKCSKAAPPSGSKVILSPSPSSEGRVEVIQFSMTQCPMTSTWLNHFWKFCLTDGDNIGNVVDFKVYSVGGSSGGSVTNATWNKSFHGPQEIVADKYELCAQHITGSNYNYTWVSFMACANGNLGVSIWDLPGDMPSCAAKFWPPATVSKIESCVNSSLGTQLFHDSVFRTSAAGIHYDVSHGIPVIAINGTVYQGLGAYEHLGERICSAYTGPPLPSGSKCGCSVV